MFLVFSFEVSRFESCIFKSFAKLTIIFISKISLARRILPEE